MKNVYIKIGICLIFLITVVIGKNCSFHSLILSLKIKKTDTIWLAVVKKLHYIHNTFTLSSSPHILGQAHAAGTYDSATAYIALNLQNGNILLQKNENAQVPIASLTKLMSAVVALDLAKPTDSITVTENLSSISPTKIGVGRGERMTLNDFLEAMLMTSANDAAQAVSDGINTNYHEDIFVKAMNEKATFLGLTHTHFSNPQGFDGNNYSSAHDLAILSAYALSHYPPIAQIVTKDYTFLPSNSAHKQYNLYNWNGLLDVYPGITGVKIGNTSQAGYTMIAASSRNGQRVLSVLLGAPGILERDEWMASLLNDAFGTLGIPPVTITSASLQAKYATWKYWN